MLQIVKPNATDLNDNTSAIQKSYDPTVSDITEDQRIAALLRCMSPDDEVRRLVETYETIELFACRLAGFYTELFPSAEAGFSCLISEVLDIATTGFLRAEGGRRDPRDCVAIFLANGVAASAMAHSAFSVEQLIDGKSQAWRPWNHGALVQWATPGIPITFRRRPSPGREERYVIRTMLAQRLLRHEDMMSIARAGIDLHSLELF